MDNLKDLWSLDFILFGCDVFVFGYLLKKYYDHNQTLTTIQDAQSFPISKQLKEYVATKGGKKIPYYIVRGLVASKYIPLLSESEQPVRNVLQIFKKREHSMMRTLFGFWTSAHELKYISTNAIPFELRSNDYGVTVSNPLSAAVLDLKLLNDTYQPYQTSRLQRFCTFFTGKRPKGLQITEEGLCEGTIMTAAGELFIDNNELCIGPSGVGPFMLTTSTKSSLVQTLLKERNKSRLLTAVFGSIAVILAILIIRRIRTKRRLERQARENMDLLAKERRQRRADVRSKNTVREMLCVICLNNPKEVICMPCGHVCMCEDCSEDPRDICPICRASISNRHRAYIP